MTIFDISRFKLVSENKHSIRAIVAWVPYSEEEAEDDETQEIDWSIQSFENVDDVLNLISFIRDHNLIDNDKITVNEDALFDQIGWKRDRFDKALSGLLAIRVDMVDDGQKTDYFFVHF